MAVDPQTARRLAALPDDLLRAECEEQFFIASGPGGQHRNKTETGVRLIHKPTGVTVTATERRSQYENRHHALERLRALFVKWSYVPEKRIATKPSRGSKRRRLEGKKIQSAKKASRRGDW